MILYEGHSTISKNSFIDRRSCGPRQANLVLIAYASSEGSGESAHPRNLARTSATRSYKQWVKRNIQTENQNPGPSEWLGMRSSSLSWRNARRHKFAWRATCILNPHQKCHLRSIWGHANQNGSCPKYAQWCTFATFMFLFFYFS